MARQALKVIHKEDARIAEAEAPHLRHVVWYRDPGLRKLYAYIAVICMASATTGYDG